MSAVLLDAARIRGGADAAEVRGDGRGTLDALVRPEPHRVIADALAKRRLVIAAPGLREALQGRAGRSLPLGIAGVAAYAPPPM